jgi:ribose transport system substrate-binding protein
MKSFAGDFWKTVQLGAEQAGKDFGVTVMVNGCDAETNFEQQIKQVEDSVTKGADAIAFSTLDSEALVPTVEAAAEKGVKFITFNSQINSEIPLAHVATDNWAAGELAGKALGEATGGKGKYAIIGAVEGVKNNRDRSDGAADYIAKNFPDMELITIQYSDNDLQKAIAIANDLMTSNPDIAGFFSNNETTTIGVATALNERGKAGEIKHIGFDSSDQTIAQLQEGVTQAIVTQVPFQMGYLAVQYAIDAINGAEMEKSIDTGVALITLDNLNDEDIQKIVNPLN